MLQVSETQKIQKTINVLYPSQEWSFQDAKRSETTYITHGYHRYPAKFIPQIVQRLIDDYTNPGDSVLDPFGGCGTTLVETKVMNRKGYSFDINPVAKLITQTKVTPIHPKTLENTRKKFLHYYKKSEATLPRIRTNRLQYWFDDGTLKELNKIYKAIKKIKNYKVRRFYLCAFSHVLKNCSKWLMKSTKPQIDQNKKAPVPLEVLEKHLNTMEKRNKSFYDLLKEKGSLNTITKVKKVNSMKRFPLGENSINLIITSPPYVTSYEYADLHQLTLLWFGNDTKLFKKWYKYVQNFDKFRQEFIGTSLKKQRKKRPVNSVIAQKIIDQLITQNVGVAKRVEQYFADINKSFQEMYRVLSGGSRVCIIIGNTKLRGVEIKNAEVTIEQMQNSGFKLEKVIKRKIINKMITPWRDPKTGRFAGKNNTLKTRVYEYEYVVIMEKI